MMRALRLTLLVTFSLALAPQPPALAPVVYRISAPEPAHRWAEVEVTVPDAPRGRPVRLRMSRSSPGRYALHEFAKNVYDVRAADGKGIALAVDRVSPHEWSVSGHDGTVRLRYKVFGDRVDGTYLAIDATHLHLNMPAALMWAPGYEGRPAEVHIQPPDPSWTVATQLFPTPDRWRFTAPNLQYLMDSPVEVGPLTVRRFTVANADGRRYEIRVAVHDAAGAADLEAYVADIERVVREQQAIFGELPAFEPGTYTVLADYLPYAAGDGMEHRNSTVVTGRLTLANAGDRRRALETVSHEFFHGWNVERIRPAGLEPFDFTRENMSDSLWLAEGFTEYYGLLTLARAGLAGLDETVAEWGGAINAVVNGPGRRVRSAAEMSRMAPFVDGYRPADPTNFGHTIISYYTWGSALALGLDLSLRATTNGQVTLDDYLRALWRAHGTPGGPQPGLVARPYTAVDLRDRLAEVVRSRSFANEFFDRYVEGREAMDYARLVEPAGLVLRRRSPGAPWIGQFSVSVSDAGATITSYLAPDSPAYGAGLEQGDLIKTIDGDAVTSQARLQEVFRRHKPGDRVRVEFLRRGTPVTATLTLAESPTLELVTLESTGGTLTDAQRAFRAAWLGSKAK
jgi:predicted metalloprotease with PDZ domain